jgi:hypothetical protein
LGEADQRKIQWSFVSLVRVIAALAAINFLAFVATTFYLGGDALNGYARNGHYFLGLHSNGPFTEVSRTVFNYSRWHALGVIVSIGFLLAAELWRRVRPKGR